MLVLSRRPQETILLPGLDIRITVLSIRPGRVQIGIDAPPEIQITRPEARRPSSECVSIESSCNSNSGKSCRRTLVHC